MARTVLITGASSGIGRAAALEMAFAGASVIATGRSAERLQSLAVAMNRVSPDASTPHRTVICDQSSMVAVCGLANEIRQQGRLDVLALNAGIQPYRREVTADGFESAIGVNHLSHFLLTHLLAPLLRDSDGRVVVTSSSSHVDGPLEPDDLQFESGWTPEFAYGRSKRANTMFAADVRAHLGVPASSFHPGDTRTDINRDAPFRWATKPFERFRFAPVEAGIGTMLWLMTDSEGADPKHFYY